MLGGGADGGVDLVFGRNGDRPEFNANMEECQCVCRLCVSCSV